MGTPEEFLGCNFKLLPPEGMEDEVQPMHAFTNGECFVSKWRLSKEELEEINRTGCVYLSVFMQPTQPPVYVGDEKTTRAVIHEYGEWPKPHEGN